MAINVTVLTQFNGASQKLVESQSMVVKTKHELQGASEARRELLEQKTGIESSLKEERLKTENLDKENQSLKANLQAKKEREAAQAVAIAQPKPQTAAATVSGSCEDWLAQAGITDLPNARILIQRESGCNPTADNPNSDAYGIPQALPGSKMASHGADWATNPVTQLKWMQSYVMGRYKSWANAVHHSSTVGWY